ncbi:MAG: hypothetical protein WEH44_05985 [Pirellulaceae bacterium]
MTRQPRQKLNLAELLIVLAMVGIGLGTARRYWHAWGTEEWTLAAAWIGAWIFAVLGVRAVTCRAVLAASVLCPMAVSGVAVYFQFSWRTTFILVVAALAIAAVTAAVPWLISRGGSWIATVFSGKSPVSKTLLLRWASLALVAVLSGAAIVYLRRPPVSTTVIRRFENLTPTSANQRQNRTFLHGVSNAGRFLVLRRRNAIEIFDTETGTIRAVPNSSELEAVVISPDGRRLACRKSLEGDWRKGMAICVDAESGRQLTVTAANHPFVISFSPCDDSMLVGTFADDERRADLERWRLGRTAELLERWKFEYPEGGRLAGRTIDGRYCRIEYSRRNGVDHWQIWKLTHPAELIMDSTNKPLRFGFELHAHGEWFASKTAFWNRSRTTQVEIDGDVLGFDQASEHLAVLTHNGSGGPSRPGDGPGDEVKDQVPFWRLRSDKAVEVKLRLYDLHAPQRTWQSPGVTVHRRVVSQVPVFNTHTAPDGSAFALQDDAGRIILWRIHRSPFEKR